MLFDLLEDLFGDLIIKGIRNVYDHLSDYSLFHPRLATAGKVLLFLLITLGGTAWFAIRAQMAWAAGENTQMQIFLAGGLMFLALCGFVGLRRLVRWYKKREETMYDPRYQK